jgi:hypothetical protein
MNLLATALQGAPSVSLFGPIDALLAPYLEYVLLVLVILNLVGRAVEYNQHVRQAEEGGADAIARNPLRVGTNFLLVVGAFYYATVEYHAGFVLSVLVVGMFITDMFEFESRKVEARQNLPIERPKGAIAASLFVFLYAAYQSVFFVIAPIWNAIV